MTLASRRFVLPLAEPGAEATGLVRAFLWLKRRIEESRRSGVLAVPSQDYLSTELSAALGWRLTDILRDEGNLPLGDGLSLAWTTYHALEHPEGTPLAALHPETVDLESLARWTGVVLVVPDSFHVWERWCRLTKALEPPPEDYPGQEKPDR